MATLFGKAKSTINEHIENIFAEGELIEASVVKKFGISEFLQKTPNYCNLDVIKAHEEYEKFRLRQLEEPTEVEKHFVEAKQELKRIVTSRKKGGKA